MNECRICGSKNVKFDKELQSIIGDNLLRYFICEHCGTIMESADIIPKYEEESLFNSPLSIKYYVETGAGLFFLALQLQLIKKILESKFSSVPENMKFLDVGTGFGFSLVMAQQLGWDTVGVEPSSMGKIGSQMLGLKNLVSCYLEDSNLPKSSFDIVTSSEVIEHILEPDAFIQNLQKYLAPKGFILLTTPNADANQLVEDEWLEAYAPGLHLNIFSPRSITLVLNRNGFEDVKIFFSEGSSGKKRMIILAAREKGILPDDLNWNEVLSSTNPFLKNVLQNIVLEKEASNEQDDVYSGVLYRLVDICVNAGQFEQSKEYIAKIDQIIHNYGLDLDSLITIQAKSLEEYIKKVPAYAGYYLFYKGIFNLNHTKNYQEAMKCFQVASHLCKVQENVGYFDDKGWYIRSKLHEGITLLYSGNQKGSLQFFDRLLTQIDDIPADSLENVYWNQGIAHLQLRENHQALRAFIELLIKKHPEYNQLTSHMLMALNQSLEAPSPQINTQRINHFQNYKNKLKKSLGSLKKISQLIPAKTVKVEDVTISEDQLEITVGELISGRLIEQEFVASEQNLSKISLKLGTLKRLNTSQFYVDILDEEKKQIRHIVKNANIFEDNYFHTFSFPVIPNSRGKKYWLRLSSNAEIDNAVTLWCENKQGDGSLIIDHKPSENALIYEVGYGEVNTRIAIGVKDILIITPDKLGKVRLGLGMRHWEIAHALAKKGLDVALATPHPIPNDVQAEGFDLHSALSPAKVLDIAQEYKVIMVQGDVLRRYPKLEISNKQIIVDMVTPFHIEDIEKGQKEFENGYSVIRQCLLRGDFFVCGNESQRIYWLGMLTALGRINKQVRDDNAAFYKLIDVAGFGIPEQPPVKSAQVLKGVFNNIHDNDFVIMWMGGIWDWLDPLTLIQGVHQAHQKDARVKLFFPAYRQSSGQPSNMAKKARDLCIEIGALDKSVFFNEYPIAYEERVNYLLESDVGVVCQAANFETQISARTRVLDYIWTGLPILINQGDEWCELVRKHNLGVVVQGNSADDWENAITELAMNAEARQIKVDNIGKIKYKYEWNHLVEPIINYLNSGAIN